MGLKTYFIVNFFTFLLKGTALALIVLWLLPLWRINIPVWGLILILTAFLTYEVLTLRMGKRALEKKPVIWSGSMVGRYGEAKTPINPKGYVRVNGILWRASTSGNNISKGQDIVVVGMERLTLHVSELNTSRR